MNNSWIVWMFSFAILFFIYHLLWSCIIHPENVLVKKTDNKISNPFSNFCLFIVFCFCFYVKVSKMRNPRTRILNVCKVSTCSVSALVNCWFLKRGWGLSMDVTSSPICVKKVILHNPQLRIIQFVYSTPSPKCKTKAHHEV